MSVWVELRCNEAHEDHANELYTGTKKNGIHETSKCHSLINDGCGELSSDASQKSLIQSYKSVSRNALNCGWKKINGQWVCPHCIKYRGRSTLDKVEKDCDY